MTTELHKTPLYELPIKNMVPKQLILEDGLFPFNFLLLKKSMKLYVQGMAFLMSLIWEKFL